MARTQLPENEKFWAWDNYAQELHLAEIGEFSRKFNKENDPHCYYAISMDPDTGKVRLRPIVAAEENVVRRDLVTVRTALGQKLTCTPESELMACEVTNPMHEDGSIRIVGEEYKLATTGVDTADRVLSPHGSDIFANHLITDDDRDYAYVIANYLLYGEQIAANHTWFDARPGFDPGRFVEAVSRVSGQKVKEPQVMRFENKEPMAYLLELPAPYASNVLGAYGTSHKLKSLQPKKTIFPIDMYQRMSMSSPRFMRYLTETLWNLDKRPVFRNRTICRQLTLSNMLYSTHLTPKVTPVVNNLDEVEYVVSYDDAGATDWVSEDVTDDLQAVRVTDRTYGNSRYMSTYALTVEDTGNFLTADCVFVKD